MQAHTLLPDQTSGSTRQKRLVQCAFLLLFPGFFFYQTLLGLGLIRAYLGGYFSLVALVLALPLGLAYFTAVKRHRHFISTLDLFLALFLVYILVVLVVNFAAGANGVIVQRYMQAVLFFIEMYVIFRLLDFNDSKFIMLGTGALLAMSFITIHFSVDGFFYLQALNDSKDPGSLATYQGFARSYVYTFLIVVAVTRQVSVRLVLYALAITTLFLNGARTEFSGVLILVPLIEFYHTRYKLFLTLPVIFLLIQFAANVSAIATLLPDNRVLQLLDLSHSTSAVARDHLTHNAWKTITQNPFFGDFASYADGHYAHNILVAWVDFGLVGFLALAAILACTAFRLFTDGFFRKERSNEFVLACSFVCLTILWTLLAKAAPDMSVGAALGAYAKYRYQRRMGRPHGEPPMAYGAGAPVAYPV